MCRLTVERQGSNAEGPAEADLWGRVCSHQAAVAGLCASSAQCAVTKLEHGSIQQTLQRAGSG